MQFEKEEEETSGDEFILESEGEHDPTKKISTPRSSRALSSGDISESNDENNSTIGVTTPPDFDFEHTNRNERTSPQKKVSREVNILQNDSLLYAFPLNLQVSPLEASLMDFPTLSETYKSLYNNYQKDTNELKLKLRDLNSLCDNTRASAVVNTLLERPDYLYLIFSHLNLVDLWKVAQVSRLWEQVSEDNVLWIPFVPLIYDTLNLENQFKATPSQDHISYETILLIHQDLKWMKPSREVVNSRGFLKILATHLRVRHLNPLTALCCTCFKQLEAEDYFIPRVCKVHITKSEAKSKYKLQQNDLKYLDQARVMSRAGTLHKKAVRTTYLECRVRFRAFLKYGKSGIKNKELGVKLMKPQQQTDSDNKNKGKGKGKEKEREKEEEEGDEGDEGDNGVQVQEVAVRSSSRLKKHKGEEEPSEESKPKRAKKTTKT